MLIVVVAFEGSTIAWPAPPSLFSIFPYLLLASVNKILAAGPGWHWFDGYELDLLRTGN